jgi:hypothetical protein
MRNVLLAVLALCLWATPAVAYHEGSLAARVGYCGTLAYAYVEGIVTYRLAITAGLEAVQATPLGAEGARTVDIVQRLTAETITRAARYLDDCLSTVQQLARPDAAAASTAEALQVEMGFASEELDALQDALRREEGALRSRLGERLAPNVTTLLSPYRTFTSHLEVEVIEFKERAGAILRGIAP